MTRLLSALFLAYVAALCICAAVQGVEWIDIALQGVVVLVFALLLPRGGRP